MINFHTEKKQAMRNREDWAGGPVLFDSVKATQFPWILSSLPIKSKNWTRNIRRVNPGQEACSNKSTKGEK